MAEVEPGEISEIETELNIGGHLIQNLDDKLTTVGATQGIRYPESCTPIGRCAEDRF